METLFITENMENQELYNYYINLRKLNNEMLYYEGVKYKVVLGEDVKRLIKYKMYLSRFYKHDKAKNVIIC